MVAGLVAITASAEFYRCSSSRRAAQGANKASRPRLAPEFHPTRNYIPDKDAEDVVSVCPRGMRARIFQLSPSIQGARN